MKKNKVTINNTIFSLLLQMVTIISGFIIPRLLISTFGSEVNGLISSINQFLNYITLIEGGVTGVVTASLYRPLVDKNKEKISAIVSATNRFFKKISYIFIFYTIGLSIIYPIIVNTGFSFGYVCTLTLILSINLFMQYFFSLTLKTLLQADKKVKFISIVQIICIIMNTIGVWILIKVLPNIHVVKLLTSLIYIIQPLAYNWYVNKNYEIDKAAEPDKKALKERWNGFGINIAAFIHNNTDVAVLTILTDLFNVSVYSVYALVTTGLKRFIQAISGGIIPTLGHAYASGDKEKLNSVFAMFELVIYISTFMLFTAGGLLITPFIQVYTKGISDTNYIQPILGWLLIIAEMLFCIREPYVNMAYVANKFKEISRYAYIEAGINVVVSVILVYKFGLIGVAIGTVISMAYRTICQIYYLKNNILHKKITEVIKMIAVFTGGMIVSIILSNMLLKFMDVSIKGWIIYAIENCIIIGIVYIIILAIFYRKEIKEIIKTVKNK